METSPGVLANINVHLRLLNPEQHLKSLAMVVSREQTELAQRRHRIAASRRLQLRPQPLGNVGLRQLVELLAKRAGDRPKTQEISGHFNGSIGKRCSIK